MELIHATASRRAALDPDTMTSGSVVRDLPEEAATAALARELSLFVRPGDCVAISGDLGSGKTALARGLIQALSPQGPGLEVPSPTFTLVQVYDDTRIPVAHFDFYRLDDPAELAETGFRDLVETHATLVEWPDRLPGELPADRLDVALEMAGSGRRARLTAHGDWTGRLARIEAVRQFLLAGPWASAARFHLNGDASNRRYERLVTGDGIAVLMDMPARPDGPPIRNGRSYGAIAHIAEDCRAVVAVNTGLRQVGLSAPELYATDLDQGLLVIEDFGDRLYGRMMAEGEDVSEPMAAAVKLLAHVAEREWPRKVPLPDGTDYLVADYDDEALGVELSLLPDWFWPLVKGEPVSAAVREEFESAWRRVLPAAQTEAPVWVLRDFHSPNLVWLPERQGINRVGLLDAQDCVFGHPAYDVASLLQDARVDVPAAFAGEMFEQYCSLRHASRRFDRAGFEAAYAVLGVQRATKILGIFARLSRRDGKHGYLRHLPRVSRTLELNLAHSALAPVRQWFDHHLPLSAREAAVQRLLHLE